MAENIHSDHVEVWKFDETGLASAVLEAAKYLEDHYLKKDRALPDVTYFRDRDGTHYFQIWDIAGRYTK